MSKVVLPVGTLRQPNDYVCGPTALKLVFEYWGRTDISLQTIVKAAKTTRRDGTLPKNLILAARSFGFSVGQKFDATLKDIEHTIDQELPVIPVYQDWEVGRPFYQDWDDGHYAVIHGYDQDQLYISDPSFDEGYRTLNKVWFFERWYDHDPFSKRHYNQWMMIVKPRKKV